MAIKLLSPTKIGNFTLPHNDGTSGQALVTDGNGNISFAHTGSLSGLSFSSGTLTATTATGTITVNLDGRYALSSHNHSGVYDNYQSWNLKTNGVQRTTVQSGGTLDLVAGSNVTLSYGAGGVVTIAAASTTETDTLATVTARGASTSTPVTFNGNVTLGNSADLIFSDLAGTFPTSGKGFDWTLNNDGARIYAIQPASDSIDLVFQLRDNATTNDRFVFWVKEWQGAAFDKYPLIISGGTQFDLKDSALYTNSVLRLSNAGALQNVTGNISMFTNDSGYITGSGSTSGNAGTATKLATARTLTIGSTGKTFDGSANVSWTLAEIGAQAAGSYAASSHTHVWTDITNRPTNVSSFTNDSGYITSSGSTSGSAGTLDREDNRTISPSELTAGKLKYGFTSWGNNNTTPYADFLHLRSYTDASGGNDNLVMFRKDAIGMRIYQQAWGSATAYSTYKDVAFTDGTNSSGTWGISITGSAGSVAWANITGTPSTFTPSSHTHAIADVTGLQTALDGKQAAGSYAAASHTHDDRYYTETEVGNFFGGTTAITGYNKSNWDTAFGWGNHASQSYATQAYVNTAVANVVNAAPAALDTLKELATALGNDASFSTTVSTALGNRLRIDTNAQGLTATQQGNGRTNLGLGTAATSNTGDFATSGHTHSAATTAAAGFMSAADKTKLDGISSGATANAGTVTSVSGTGSYGGLTLSGTVTSSGSLTLGGTPTGTWPISISGSSDTVDGYHASGLWKLNEWNGSIYGHTDGRIYGTIFYDSNDSAYYADPASNSNLNGVSARQYYQSLHGEPRNNLGDPTVTDMALFDAQFNNKTELYPASKIKFFTSADGTNYSEYTGFSDVQKQRLVTGDDNSGVYIPNLTNRFRIELDARGYVAVSMLYLYWSSNSHSTKIQIWYRRCDNQTWYQHTNSSTNVSSWPGHVTLPFPSLWWLEGGTSSGHCDKIRIEFIPSWSGHPTYGGNVISLDRLQLWGGYPAGKRNVFHTNYAAEVTFPSNVYSSSGKLATESFVTSQGYLTSVPAQSWSSITGKPTTISGFGITDAITTSNIGSQSVNYATSAGSATSATTAGNVTGTVAIANGGTGSTTAAGARTNLGLGTAATSNTGDFATAGHSHSNATTAAAGFMSAADKSKLDGIASGATANSGTVTSVSGTGTVSGITLSGTVTSSGSLTLGGSLSLTSAQVTTALGYTPYNATNPNGYTSNTGTVTSVSGTGSVNGLTLSGTVTSSGNLTLSGSISASIDNITDEPRIFNNMGQNHGTRSSFDASTPSYDFGWRFIQGNANGPGVNSAAQYYSLYIGLGNDYAATGAGSYGLQLAIPRDVTTPYLAIRYNENNSLRAWQKISAGYADSAGSVAWTNVSGRPTAVSSFSNDSGYITSSGSISGNAGSATVLQTARTLTIGNTGKTFNGSANVSWSLAEIGAQAAGSYAAASHTHTPSEVGLGNVSNVAQVTTTNNSSLNSDSRNTRGVTRLYRRDDNSDYSVQTYWTGSYWRLYGYNGDSGHADTHVGYSDSSGYASSAGAVAWGNVSGRPTNVSSFSNDSGYVTGGSSPTFTEVYANNWFRNNEANEGLYNQATTQHWSSRENGYWDASSTTTVSAIRFYTGGHVSSLRGYVYANTSNEIGFLNSAGSWSLRCDNSGNVTATGDLTAYSDARIKTNISTVENALDKVLQLRGVTYQRTDTEDKSTKVGLIAQEVKEVLPEVVTEQTDGLLSVSYGNMVGVLIEAMKEQQAIIETLEAKIELLTKYLK